uniref:Copper transport protein n=1 Tax=Ditylenchus dipsaci TaxID=166011 RepID=A0A915EAD0_9BILA
MKMYFHGGCTEVILFDLAHRLLLWSIVFLCSDLFYGNTFAPLQAATYEGIKWFRVYFQMCPTASQPTSVLSYPLFERSEEPQCEDALIQKTSNGIGNNQQHAISRRMFDFLNSTLTIAYWLMLIIMTYNVYLTGRCIDHGY